MKNLFRKILFVVLVFGAYTGNANEVVDVSPTYNFVKKGSQISVTDALGDVIYRGEINHNGNLISLFDFTQLKNGKYTVEVIKDFKIEINTIEVKNNVVSLINADRKITYKPLVRNENDKILISKLALNAKTMKIELYFEGKLISSEVVEGDKVLNRVYKLDKTLSGDYTAVITSDDRVFIENFRI